jgi:hypothetical protein
MVMNENLPVLSSVIILDPIIAEENLPVPRSVIILDPIIARRMCLFLDPLVVQFQ